MSGAQVTQRDLPLFGEPVAYLERPYRRRMVQVMVGAHLDQFRGEFAEWLASNLDIWEAFETEADKVWNRGRRRYSARTIGEYLRHESALREGPNEHGWKLNDHWWPDLARLYLLMHPDRDGFFERRVSPASLRAA